MNEANGMARPSRMSSSVRAPNKYHPIPSQTLHQMSVFLPWFSQKQKKWETKQLGFGFLDLLVGQLNFFRLKSSNLTQFGLFRKLNFFKSKFIIKQRIVKSFQTKQIQVKNYPTTLIYSPSIFCHTYISSSSKKKSQ